MPIFVKIKKKKNHNTTKIGFILFMHNVDYPLTKLLVDFGSDTRNCPW